MAYKTNMGGVSAAKQTTDPDKEAKDWLKKNARTHPDGDALFTADASGNEITKAMLKFAKGKVSNDAYASMRRLLETSYDQKAVLTDYKIFGL